MSAETKERILDAAELLFARQGLKATSLRSITNEAGVNAAAIHYHFGSREVLLQAVVQRRIAPLAQARLKQLELLEASAAGGPIALDDLLHAFLSPLASARSELGPHAHTLMQLFVRLRLEGESPMDAIHAESSRLLRERFVAAFHRSCPHLSEHEIDERLDYAMGALMHALHRDLAHNEDTSALTRTDEDEIDRRISRAIGFLVAGFRAPANDFSLDRAVARSAGGTGR